MNIKYLISVGILLLNLSEVIACKCSPIDSASAQQLIKHADYVLIGHAVQNINFNLEVRDSWNQRKTGYQVLVKVDSVIKGNVKLTEVIINQLSNGSCEQEFAFGKQFIIAGNHIKKFVNKSPKESIPNKGEIATDLPPPPPSLLIESTMFCYSNTQDEVDYWNELTENYTVLFTSQCSTISVNRLVSKHFRSK